MSKRVTTTLLAIVSLLVSLLAVGSVSQPAWAAPAAFTHPGVLVSRAQLDYIRAQVNAGAQPQTQAYQAMMSDALLSQSRQPTPRSVVECGPYSNPNLGCTNERQDALAAYGNALAWYITQNATYAQKAIAYMDAWSGTITSHTNSNAPLQTGWAGSVWPRAAEIIRYTYTGGWANLSRFQTMLRNVYLPVVIKGSFSNGNWELTMMEAAVGISVFLDDKTSYDTAMAKYMLRVPAYVYLSTDGALPKTVPGGPTGSSALISYWQGQSTFVNGLTQETCRDFTHTGYGIASISDVAETSRIQGTDLYGGDIGTRLRYALGFQAQYELGAAVPSWLCGGAVNKGLGPVTEVGYNALAYRGTNVMTNTKTLVTNNRPAGDNILFVAWETLTHGNQPN
ncbi:alginate lyase family protein [Kutzneria sp. NPDC052558]|uniref:alginate lyase family protein n=1 Tax=Kutzneria sp. NPDC052558 TaxID=3364121 RepID=UPI0037CBEEF2